MAQARAWQYEILEKAQGAVRALYKCKIQREDLGDEAREP